MMIVTIVRILSWNFYLTVFFAFSWISPYSCHILVTKNYYLSKKHSAKYCVRIALFKSSTVVALSSSGFFYPNHLFIYYTWYYSKPKGKATRNLETFWTIIIFCRQTPTLNCGSIYASTFSINSSSLKSILTNLIWEPKTASNNDSGWSPWRIY